MASVKEGGLEEYLPVKVPHTVLPRYPFLLQTKLVLPWDVEIRRSAVFLRAHACKRIVISKCSVCVACRGLLGDSRLQGIIRRMNDGVAENTPFEYQGLAGMHEIAHRKDQQNNEMRLRRLNEVRRAVRLEGAISVQKELVVAISEARVPRMGNVLRMCFRRGMGVHSILELVSKASSGVYHPKSYEEEDEARGLLMLRLGGTRVAEVSHRLFGTPSTSTLRRRTTSPILLASPSKPVVREVQHNLDESFALIQDELGRIEDEILHTVVMWDELVVERRPRWCHRTNKFLGSCRECTECRSLEFASEEDVKLYFEEIDEGKIHLASEATVGAVGLLTSESSLYSARPVLLSGSCKRESDEKHQELLQTTIDAVNSRRNITRARIVSLASDGESRRGRALVNLTFKHQLAPSSPIYEQLSGLPLMDLWVGDDDVTVDKDYKHVAFKRVRNALLREKGVLVLGVYLTPAVTRAHLCDAGHSAIHVNYLFNASDKQDVMVAFQLLWAIHKLPLAPTSSSPAYQQARNALRIFGDFCYNLIFPYVCVDLSLVEQLQHHSSAVHLGLSLYTHEGAKGRFLPLQLMVDIVLMIKNIFFCVAKAKQDRPNSKFYVIQLGTDRVETLFGILRTMVGSDANLDILQLALRCSSTTEVANIFARHPDWQPKTRRLHLPALAKDATDKQPVADTDHITPRSWRGDVRVSSVNLRTPWTRGRHVIEQKYPDFAVLLRTIEDTPNATILAPFGTLLVHSSEPVASDEAELLFEPAADAATEILRSTDDPLMNSDGLAELEDSTTELDLNESAHPPPFSRFLEIGGTNVNKSRVLAHYNRWRSDPASTDRLKRVQLQSRFGPPGYLTAGTATLDDGPFITVCQPIATLVACDGKAFLALGEIIGLKVDCKTVDEVPLAIISEATVQVSYQLLGLVPATKEDDPSEQHDWRSTRLLAAQYSVPGALVQPINPAIINRPSETSFYLLDSQDLIALASSLRDKVIPTHTRSIPSAKPTDDFPYRERRGARCFVTGPHLNVQDHVGMQCPYCNYPLDPKKGQRVLEHIGSHILYDTKNIDPSTEPCGLCLRPHTICQIHVKISNRNGKASTPKILWTRSTCTNKVSFQYKNAMESTGSAPCSNVPLKCPLCPAAAPAVWRYNFRSHHKRAHPATNIDEPALKKIYRLKDFEWSALRVTYENRRKIPKPRTKKIVGDLPISEVHSSHMVFRAGGSTGSEDSPIPDSEYILEGEGSDDSMDSEESEQDDDEEEGEEANDGMRDSDNGVNCDPSSTTEHGIFVQHAMSTSFESNIERERRDEGRDMRAHDGPLAMVPPLPPPSPEMMFPSPTTAEENPHTMDDDAPSTSSAIQADLAPSSARKSQRPRRGTKRKNVLSPCSGCDEYVVDGDANVVECTRAGCEIRFFHKRCVSLDIEVPPRNWACQTCADTTPAGDLRGGRGKRRRGGVIGPS